MPSGRTHRSSCAGLHSVTSVSIVVQGTHLKSDMHMQRGLVNAASTTTSRWSAGHYGDNM